MVRSIPWLYYRCNPSAKEHKNNQDLWNGDTAISIATGGIRDVAEVTQSDLKVPDVVRMTTFHGSLEFKLFYLFVYLFSIWIHSRST